MVPDHYVNDVFSESQTSDLVFRSFDDSANIDEIVSDSENYVRTRSHSEGYASSPEIDRRLHNGRPLTPQAIKSSKEKFYAQGQGRGKFSQRCINQNLHREFKRVGDDSQDAPSDSSVERNDAMDIKKEPEELPSFSLKNFDRKKKFLAASLAMTNFAAMFCLSVMAPFFPQKASSVGVSDTVSGWIFGVFALVQFLTSPIFGKLVRVLYC
jgi:uncharacterized membrane protein (DUF485 family)